MIALNSPLKPDLKKLQGYLEGINKSGWYTNFGPLHEELTARLEEYLGVENLLLVSNATLGLQVAGQALGAKSILATPFSFIATVSAFKWQEKKIAFADVDRASYNLCPQHVNKAFEQGSDADTILATHVYGNPCDVSTFDQVQKTNNSKIIYDAAHAFGVKVGDTSVLNYGDASVLSFHATKVFHTLEGGAIVFKDKEVYQKAKNIINFGIDPDKGIAEIGINAKLNEYQAAVGLVNLEMMDEVLEHRSELFHYYREALKGYVELPKWHNEATYNGAYMPIKLKDRSLAEQVLYALAENNIQSRLYFHPSLDLYYSNSKNYGTKNSNAICDGILCFPMHAYLNKSKVNIIVSAIKSILNIKNKV